jgi:signal transduction histidine kinase
MPYFLLLISSLSRVISHPANLTPVGAISIYATQKYGFKKSILITICALVISDIFLGFGFYTPSVYIGFIAYIVFQKFFKKFKLSPIYSAICGSTFFFLITNFSVFLGPWYEHTFNGLIKCFALALPFYRNMIIGDIGFLAVIFGLEYLVNKITSRKIWLTNLRPTSLMKKY